MPAADAQTIQNDITDLTAKRNSFNDASAALDGANAAQSSAQADFNVKRQALHDAVTKALTDIASIDPTPTPPSP